MAASLAQNDNFHAEADRANRRRAPRAIVDVEAMVISSRGESALMSIGNVSLHGCNIRGDAAWLRIGSFVGVGLGREKPLQAIVRWLRDSSAGLEFMRPIPADNAAWQDLISSIDEL